MEIERKWLVAGLPHGTPVSAHLLEQVYVPSAPESEVRVRCTTDLGGECSYGVTLKKGRGLVRQEVEAETTRGVYEAARSVSECYVRKVRTVYPLGGGLYAELDEFQDERGVPSGCVVEVEFADEAEAHAFVPPKWFGEEVTDDARYTNAHVARHGFPQ